jgi:hypothetical protein
MGFGVADRVVSLQSDQQPAPTQRFTPSTFPGESLSTLRSINKEALTLQVDLAALTPALSEPEQAVNPPIAVGVETKPALQLPSTEGRAWSLPAWSDPDADLPPSALSTDSITDMELEKPHSTVLLSPPPEVVPPAEASLLIVEPEPSWLRCGERRPTFDANATVNAALAALIGQSILRSATVSLYANGSWALRTP